MFPSFFSSGEFNPVAMLIPYTQKHNVVTEGAWKVVTRKSKDKSKQAAYQSARTSV